jgi:WD40 repeat protein
MIFLRKQDFNMRYLVVFTTLTLMLSLSGLSIAAQELSESVVIHAVEWSPDGTMLAMGLSDGSIEIRSTDNRLLLSISASTEPVFVIDWHPDGTKLASSGLAGTVNIWNISDPEYLQGDSIASWSVTQGSTIALEWNSNGSLIAWGNEGASERSPNFFIADIREYKIFNSFYTTGVSDIAWHPHQSDLIAVGNMTGLYLFNSEYQGVEGAYGRKVLSSDVLLGSNQNTTEVSWNSDGTKIAFGLDTGQVYIVDAVTFQQLNHWDLHNDAVTAIDWHPSENFIATASNDGTLKIIDLENDRVLQIFPLSSDYFTNSIDWNPDGNILAYGDVGTSPILLEPFANPTDLAPIPNLTGE